MKDTSSKKIVKDTISKKIYIQKVSAHNSFNKRSDGGHEHFKIVIDVT